MGRFTADPDVTRMRERERAAADPRRREIIAAHRRDLIKRARLAGASDPEAIADLFLAARARRQKITLEELIAGPLP